MAIADDFSVAVSGEIRYTGTTANYTVLELHRFLQDLADQEAGSGDDLLDITSETPSDRSTDAIVTLINGFNIDDDAAEHLFAGSITQDNGDTVYSGLRVLGSVNNTNTQLVVIQDNNLYQFTTTPATPFWGDQSTGGYNGDAIGGILMRVLIKSRFNGADIDQKKIRVQARHWQDTYDFFNVTLGQGESVAAIGTTPDAQNTTAQGTVTVYADVLNTGGTANAPLGGFVLIDLNNGAGNREYYSEWTFGSQPDGLKALWEYLKDLSGNTTAKTIDGLNGEFFLGITHEVVYDNLSGVPAEQETVVWGTKFFYDNVLSGPFTPGNYVTIGALGAAGRVLFDDGTDELIVALEDPSITLLNDDVVTEFPGPGAGATTTTADLDTGGGATVNNADFGGSGLLLADDTADTIWIQLLTGNAPVNNIPLRGITSAFTALVNVTITPRTVPKIFMGSYTGSLIGAYGFGVDPNDLTASDTIEDLSATTQQPPNNVTFIVTGIVSGEDRVLVGPRSGTTLNKAQDTHTALLTDGVSATMVMTTVIPTDTPVQGTVRIEDDNGVFVSIPYQSYTASTYTFTGQGTGFFEGSDNSNAAALTDVFISYIDELASGVTASFTSVFLSTRDLFVRVRDGGGTPIKTFESDSAQLTSVGGTVAAIRTTDA
jgi:hypothetical protein